jgi:hypothetical protein
VKGESASDGGEVVIPDGIPETVSSAWLPTGHATVFCLWLSSLCWLPRGAWTSRCCPQALLLLLLVADRGVVPGRGRHDVRAGAAGGVPLRGLPGAAARAAAHELPPGEPFRWQWHAGPHCIEAELRCFPMGFFAFH